MTHDNWIPACVILAAPSGLAALKLAEALYPHMVIHDITEAAK